MCNTVADFKWEVNRCEFVVDTVQVWLHFSNCKSWNYIRMLTLCVSFLFCVSFDWDLCQNSLFATEKPSHAFETPYAGCEIFALWLLKLAKNALISTKYNLVLAVVHGQFPQFHVMQNLVGILVCDMSDGISQLIMYTFTVHAMLSCMVVLQIIVLLKERLGPRNTLAR